MQDMSLTVRAMLLRHPSLSDWLKSAKADVIRTARVMSYKDFEEARRQRAVQTAAKEAKKAAKEAKKAAKEAKNANSRKKKYGSSTLNAESETTVQAQSSAPVARMW